MPKDGDFRGTTLIGAHVFSRACPLLRRVSCDGRLAYSRSRALSSQLVE